MLLIVDIKAANIEFLDSTCLDLRYGRCVPIAKSCNWQIKFPLVVSLSEELLADLKAPLPADFPGSAGV